MLSPEEIAADKKKSLRRTIIISLLLVCNVLVIYLYYYVLIFNTTEAGKVYGESTNNSAQYKIHTLKYYYQHNGVSYFDKIDNIISQELEVGDSLELRVFKPYPAKHMIQKVTRDVSQSNTYHHEDNLQTLYHSHITDLKDYEPKKSYKILTPEGNHLILSDQAPQAVKDKVVTTIDNVRFNRGSLIEYFVLRANQDSIILHSVYHYLNDFSIDAMPAQVMQKQLQSAFPHKNIKISILDKNNAKRERQLKLK